MKVTYENIESGIASYLDNEFLSQYEATSIQKTLIGVAISLLLQNKRRSMRDLVLGDMGKNLGITDEEGMIDIDLLRDVIKTRITDEGVKYENSYIGTVTFHRDDIDTLYSYITKNVNGGMNHD